MISAVKSLLLNSDVEKIYLLIEDDDFPCQLPSIVEVRNVSAVISEYFDPNGPNYNTLWTPMGLIRAALPFIFPDIDSILSLDCDTIVNQDISEIWDFDLTGVYFAAAVEPLLSAKLGMTYTNSGVMLMNLRQLRDGKADDIIKSLNRRPYRYVTQDAFNNRCQGHIRELPSDYNVAFCTKATENKKIIHYAADKNWRGYDLVRKYRDMTWEEVLHEHSNSSSDV